MNKQPFVSFCFTTFKRHGYLKSTLEGIRRQTLSDFEVIVSDNDPEGSGRAIVESFNSSQFKYFPNGRNLGMKQSFNKSLERSTGEYIVMIADDDPVYHDMLETLFELKEKHPGYGMYLGGCNWFCTEPELARMYHCNVGVNSCLAEQPVGTVTVYSAEHFLKSFFNYKIFPNYLWSAGMVKRDVLVKMGGVPDYGTPFLGDYAYMSIMGGHSGCVIVNKALGHQTLHNQNFGRDQNEDLVILAPNFIEYVSGKLQHVHDWPVIKSKMVHFVAVWLVTHLAFLQAYYQKNKNKEGALALKDCSDRIFKIPEMRPYLYKYVLLTKTPTLHHQLVQLKKFINQRD